MPVYPVWVKWSVGTGLAYNDDGVGLQAEHNSLALVLELLVYQIVVGVLRGGPSVGQGTSRLMFSYCPCSQLS